MIAVTPDLVYVDTTCPACFWPERTYDIATRLFGCERCPHTSDERNA